MGFFNDIKNSLTGGWADVSVITGEARRGEPLDVAVNVSVSSSDIAVGEVYVKLECREVVEIDNYRVQVRGQDGHGESDYVDVVECEELFEQRFVLARGQALAADTRHAFEGTVDIPPHLPPSYSGRNTRIEWRLYAGLEMKGNDPDSGWKEITVE